MTYIPPTNKKDAISYRKQTTIITKAVGVLAIISILAALIKNDWDFAVLGIVLLIIIPILKMQDWIEFNNAKQVEDADDRSEGRDK